MSVNKEEYYKEHYGDWDDEDPPRMLKRPELRNTIPEDNLDAAALWMNNKSSERDLEQIEQHVKNARKKQEVFAIQKANSSAVRYAELFRLFWQEVIPATINAETLYECSPREKIAMLDTVYRILDKEGGNLTDFLLKGPQDVPPIAPQQKNFEMNDPNYRSAEQEAFAKIQALDGDGRDKMRMLVEALEQTSKDIVHIRRNREDGDGQ